MKKLKFKIIFVFTVVFFSSVILIYPTSVKAGVSGSEGGVCYGSQYDIGAGGKVTFKLYYSDDCIIIGKKPADKTIQGKAAGSYPSDDVFTSEVFIAQGYVTLGQIEIAPDTGYEIKDLVVNGKSKGTLSSYTFTEIQNSFKVEFAETASSSRPAETCSSSASASKPFKSSSTTAKQTKSASLVPSTPASSSDTGTKSSLFPASSVVQNNQTSSNATSETEDVVSNEPTGQKASGSIKPNGIPCWLIIFLLLLILLIILFLLLFYYKREEEKKKRARKDKQEQSDETEQKED